MIDSVIAHYKILGKLGEGGMGVVYKAEDLKLKRIVALKFLPQHLTSTDAERARFLQEAQSAATLNHPNICTIHAIEEHEGMQFIDMEFVEGPTLRQKLPIVRVQDALTYALQIGDALHEAHSKGIVHRDIKADNIMLSAKNQIKVMDFGLAKLKGSLKLTRTSSTVGTLAYMAPEQIQGGDVDARSDIFSFGILLFEMLTGRTPFRGEHEAAVMYSIVNEEPDALLKIKPDLPAELERIVRRSLEKDPDDRYQSMADMVSELRRVQKQSTKVSRTMPVDALAPQVVSHASAPAPTSPAPEPASAAPARPARSMRKALFIGAAVIILAALAVGYFTFFRTNQSIDSLAVLPFENVGADPNTEYLSDGITETLINNLSQLSSFTVMSRSSVFHFKGKDIDPQEAGKKLGVKAVLIGRVTQRGDNLQISTELVDVARNSHIWGEQYNRRLSDILAVQQEIAKEISEKLRLTLTGEEEKKLAKRATENTDAYQLYLKGRFYWNKRRAADLQTAIEYFNRAIEKDSGYALAYAGLASTLAIYPEYAGVSPQSYIDHTIAAANRAIELDPSLGEAHASLGLIYTNYIWNWTLADDEFKKALALNPNYPTTHHWYCINLLCRGQFDEALAQIQQAHALDPLSLIINENIGDVYNAMGNYDKAIEACKTTIELDPNFPSVHGSLGVAYVGQQRYAEALEEFRRDSELAGLGVAGDSWMGYAYGLMGRKDEARKILDSLITISKERGSLNLAVALVYRGLGDDDQTFHWLDRAVDAHDSYIRLLKVSPEWAPIRSDKRFVALLTRIGLQ